MPITLKAIDVNGDPLTYQVSAGPIHGVITGSGASQTYTPDSGYVGEDSFMFTAYDGQVDSAPATVSITVARIPAGRIAYGYFGTGTGIRVLDTVTMETQIVPIDSRLIPNAGNPDWTPDGQWIVFNGNPGGGPSSQIYTLRPDGTDFRQITGGAGNLVMPDASPDGTRVAYHQVYGDVFIINFDGTGLTDLGYGIGGVDWSPDGRKLAGTDWAHLGGYNSDLWVWDLATGSKVKITNRPAGTAYVWPSWSPDGGMIAASFIENGHRDVVLINLDGADITNLTTDWSWDADGPTWSPDGQYILFTSEGSSGGSDIWCMRPDGSEKTRLISGDGAWVSSPAMTGPLQAPDTTPPTIICPADIVASTDLGQCSAAVSFSVSATDDSGSVAVECNAPSGSVFPKGTTTVVCVATDAAGNTAECSFTITVQDMELPTISCPADVILPCSGDLLALASYSASAQDNCTTQPTVAFSPPSGSGFPVGVTTVTAAATDESGNTSTCSFKVTRAPLGFNGFLLPIGGADETGGSFVEPLRTFKLGSTIPVKFTASCSGAPITTGIHRLQAVKYSDATNSDEPIDASPQDTATTGNQFRLTDGQWHFNLDTKATGMTRGIWQLVATLSDGSQHWAWIQVK